MLALLPLNSKAFIDQAVGQTRFLFETKISLSLPGYLFSLFVQSYAITLMHLEEPFSIHMVALLCQFHVAVNALSKLLRFFLVILRVKGHFFIVFLLKSDRTLFLLARLERHAILCGWAKKFALLKGHTTLMVFFTNCADFSMVFKVPMDAKPILFQLFITSLLDE